MNGARRFWSTVAVAVLLVATAAPALEPAAVTAAPVAGTAQRVEAAASHPEAAKAKKNKGKKAKADRGDRERGSTRAGKGRGGKKNRPTPTPPPPPPASQDCLRVMVPAYFEPQEYWDGINAAAPTTGLVILNPNSGPDKPDATWKARTEAAQKRGITVVGYVLTQLGNRPKSDVRADIKAYYDWFGVDGIYLDETSNDHEDVAYYREMAEYARSLKPGAVVAVNPGFTPPEAFMEFADYVETFEYDFATYKQQSFPDWTRKYPAERFIHVVHSVPGPDAAQRVLDLARERNAGWVFITDVDNPDRIYKSLGGNLWDETLAGVCASA